MCPLLVDHLTYWNYANHFTYNAAGAVTSMQLGNGGWESTTFNSRLQPMQIALGKTQETTNLLDLDYTYGTSHNNGNVMSQTINVPSVGQTNGFTAVQTYSYDSLNRLQQAYERPEGWTETNCTSDPTQCWKQTFTFDRYGNRNFDETNTTFVGFDKLCNSYTELCPDLRKKLNPAINTSNNKFSSGQDYDYDPSGNTTDDPYGREFIYDAENKQVKVLDAEEETIGEYFYDGYGRRVKKYVPPSGEDPGETTVFVYDAAGKLIEEYSTIVAAENDAKVAYLTNDHLGSPRINTDANGAVTARHDYHPFGEEIATSRRTAGLGYIEDTVRKQFTGYERDNESDLDFAQARYFSSGFGRFSSPDDFMNDTKLTDPASWNLYVYVRNNPLKLIDPFGEDIENSSDKRRRLSKDQLAAIENDLRKKTGLSSIAFDTNGKLTYDKNEKASGGSAKLRQAITGAIDDSKNIFQLGNYSGSEEVTFSKTDRGTVENGVTTYQVQIDFSDFQNAKSYSDSDAVNAFSIGLNIYHEIDHKVSYDPNDPTPPGPARGTSPDEPKPGWSKSVIENVNVAESELGLIQRDPGAHAGRKCTGTSALCKPGVYEIPFKHPSGQTKYLRWKHETSRP